MERHIIHGHSRANLVEDGDLVEIPWIVSNPAGLKYPVAFSRAAWLTVMDGIGQERWPETPDALEEAILTERATRTLRAAVSAVRAFSARGEDGDRVPFDVPLYDTRLHLHIGPGDDPEPVFTVFMPDED
ncbi:hypothetical protein OG612_45595 (plasmid) [Streptomyces sp. NBC_01527]|uniref:DUF6573 family protein n=1 Tax=Streptomyces sp. NBC_01527 TaxID=2903894 RepID=UPI002F916106